MPPSSLSQGRPQRPRTDTSTERVPPRATGIQAMDVDCSERPSTSQGSGAGAAVRPEERRADASHTPTQPSDQCQRAGQKAKQRATDQQGIRAMVANALKRQGVEPEDWERSQRTNYRVDPLRPPTWVVHPPPGRHLATLEGVSEDEWRAEPDITPDELFRRLTQLVRGTSQACSYRSQELYFRMMQVFKETIQDYDDEQGVQYGENAVHLDRDIVGTLLAAFVHLQRELQIARDSQQQARDREVNANFQCKEAERRETQLKCDLRASQNEVLRTEETARENERLYHETLVLLKRAQDADPTTANAEDQARIQTLEAQLDNALQQLDRLRVERAPGAVGGQTAGHPSEVEEQLDALHAENAVAHTALEEITAERDNLRKAQVQLQKEMLTRKSQHDAATNALEVRCLTAESEVVELKEKIATLERRLYHTPPPTASATVGSHPHSASGGRGSGLVAQVSPQPGRIRGIPTIRASPSLGRGARVLAAMQLWASPDTGRDQVGRFALAPGQRLGAPAAGTGQAQGPGGVMDVDGADSTSETPPVRTGDDNTMTDQDPA